MAASARNSHKRARARLAALVRSAAWSLPVAEVTILESTIGRMASSSIPIRFLETAWGTHQRYEPLLYQMALHDIAARRLA